MLAGIDRVMSTWLRAELHNPSYRLRCPRLLHLRLASVFDPIIILQYVLTKLFLPSIEIATRAADHFTRIYYTAYDSNTRLDDLPKFYRPSSSLTWNGKPFQGADGLRQLIENMPSTKHEVQSFDCHPIPGHFFFGLD